MTVGNSAKPSGELWLLPLIKSPTISAAGLFCLLKAAFRLEDYGLQGNI